MSHSTCQRQVGLEANGWSWATTVRAGVNAAVCLVVVDKALSTTALAQDSTAKNTFGASVNAVMASDEGGFAEEEGAAVVDDIPTLEDDIDEAVAVVEAEVDAGGKSVADNQIEAKQKATREKPPTTWALVLRFCWQDPLSYFCAVTFSVCTSLLSITEASLMKSFFDSVSGRRKGEKGSGSGEQQSATYAIVKLVLVVIGESVCAMLASSSLASATNSLKQKLREYLLDKLLLQDESYFDSHAVGAITQQVNEDVNEIGTALRIAFSGRWSACCELCARHIVDVVLDIATMP